MTQMILWEKTGKELLCGETAFADVDVVMTHDVGTAGVAPLVEQYGLEHFAPGLEMVVILDHFVPASNLTQANSHVIARNFVKKWNVEHFYEVGRGGICHQVMLEDGFARSGQLVVATDAHVTTYGGAGCMGLGVGVTDAAIALATGKIWVRMPKTIGVHLTGELSSGVTAKDLSIELLRTFPFSQLNYAVVEFFGPGISTLSMDQRFCLCNMLSEGGIKSCLVAGDALTEEYMRVHARGSYRVIAPEEGAKYDLRREVDLGDVVPMVALPHHPTNGAPLSEVRGKPIQQAFIGSCTNGRLEDLRAAAEILQGKKINEHVRLVVTPGSQKILFQAIEEGLISVFIAAGAMVTNPSCGACIGASSLLAPGERCISTSNRNFRGRMGSVDAEIYLASPVTVAKSALVGMITD